jgi:hypothetical protein
MRDRISTRPPQSGLARPTASGRPGTVAWRRAANPYFRPSAVGHERSAPSGVVVVYRPNCDHPIRAPRILVRSGDWGVRFGYVKIPGSLTGQRAHVPTTDTIERFIARVEQNAHAEAVEEFYTTGSSMQENQSPPRVGRDKHVAAERNVMSRAKSVSSRCVRPVFVNGDKVVIRWIFQFEWLDGTLTHVEELAYQRWDGERIAEETFFYDPAQRVPKQS